MTKKTPPAPSLKKLDDRNPDARNRLLLAWLEDDAHRSELFRLIREERGGLLVFPSRDSGQRDCECVDLGGIKAQPVTGQRLVALVTDRQAIEEALLNKEGRYSSRIYAELGGGSFMLALDPAAGTAHDVQRAAYKECFPRDPEVIGPLAEAACDAAAVMALKASDVDLAHFAEQAALRFCQLLMGYSFRDYPMMEETLRAAYRGLVYQVLGRHFVTDPLAIPVAKQALGLLLARTSKLIDAYEAQDEDELKGCDDPARPGNVRPVLEQLGNYNADLNGEQRAIIAVGAVVGTVGNVQAAACIAVSALFANSKYRDDARELLRDRTDTEPRKYARWQRLVQAAMAANPPIPFLPRFDLEPAKDQPAEILLALGGATRVSDEEQDPLIWGLPGGAPHHCAGQALAWPLIVEIVRRVMSLPGLEERRDAEDATVIGLKKRWGFACESYPLTYQRERRIAQSSLNVAMRLRSPVQKYAAVVREVIRAGAPRIEEALRSARHVHFAWFELVEGDTVLVLHTVYDGPFFAYIQDFALRVGDLFDALFECIENPPPMPVGKFPNEFVAHIQRYDRPPTMGYFFSAYPNSEVARIQRAERAWVREQERDRS
ncbi:MAG: hypothetical protein K0Q43_1843 [Ramlibacter sp.]|jgi:hypothetical protein|nr:hypothetical protein [Ramlibacter sp.]